MSNPKFEKGMREAMRNSQREKLARAEAWRNIFGAALFLILAGDAWDMLPMLCDDAPPLQRVTVVTEGFKDKKGVWRSFDNGEPITVTEWRP